MTARPTRTAAALLAASLSLIVSVTWAGAPGAGAAAAEDPAAVGAWNGSSWLASQLEAGRPLSSFGSPNWGVTLDAGIAVAATDDLFGTDTAVLSQLWADVVANREAIVVVGGSDNTGLLAKAILLGVALGEDPRAVGASPGADLVARLLATQQVAGDDAGLFGNGSALYDGAVRQSLALMALVAAGQPVPATAVKWLVDQQCADGSWMPYRSDPSVPCAFDAANFVGPDTNSTGFAMLALGASGGAAGSVTGAGSGWLESIRNQDGGWGFYPGDPSDANSSAVAGRIVGGSSAVAAIRAFQIDCDADSDDVGAFDYLDDVDANLLATNDAVAALAALAGDAEFVAPDVPCAATTGTTTTTTSTSTSSTTSTTAAPSSSTTAPQGSSTVLTPSTANVLGATEVGSDPAAGASATPLAVTGGDPLPQVLTALLLLCAGGVLTVLARRVGARGATADSTGGEASR